MAFKVQFLRGNEAQNASYTGAAGEITIDVTNHALHVHDGTTVGGHRILGAGQINTQLDQVISRVEANEVSIEDINGLITTINEELGDRIHVDQKGANDGVAPLDANGKVPLMHINDAVLGQVEYMGTWNAETNTPALPATPEKKGDYYVTSTAGSFGGIDFEVGDWIISKGDTWEKVNNTDAVASVAGKTGVVVLDKADVGLDQVDNTSDMDKPVSTAQQAALDALQADIDTRATQTALEALQAEVDGMDTGVSSVSGTGAVTVDNTNPANPVVGLDNATSEQAGAMSAADKSKLDTVESGAQVNTVTGVAGRTGDVELTKADVGLDNVANYTVATVSQAEEANANDAFMTPLRVRNFFENAGFAQDTQSGRWFLDQGTLG